MMKRKRSRPPGGIAVGHGERHSSADDAARLLLEWRRQIAREKTAARQRRLLTSSVHPSSLDPITAVTHIGRLRLLRKWARGK
jgi:hypothetical protein